MSFMLNAISKGSMLHFIFKGKFAHNFNGITFIRNYHIVLLECFTNSHKKNSLKRKTVKKDSLIGPNRAIYSRLSYVFKREFPLCDVPQGVIGDPPFLKGNPPVGECYCTKIMIKFVSHTKILGYPPFFISLNKCTWDYHAQEFRFIF